MNHVHLFLDNISNRAKALKIGLFIGLMLVLTFLGYQLVVRDSVAEFKQLKAQETRLKTDFEYKQSQLVNQDVYRQQIKELHDDVTQIAQQLAYKSELPNLLEEMSRIGLASGVRFELFAPQTEIQHQLYVEFPVKMAVRGNYSQLTLFLNHISSMTRIVILHQFSVKKFSKKRFSNELIMQINLSLYRRINV